MNLGNFMKSGFLVVFLATGLAARGAYAQNNSDQDFGRYVLDVMTTVKTAESIADRIRSRSIEVRTPRGEVDDEEHEWYEHHRDGEHETKPGGGPPPWAPAHGYRRKFGAEEEQQLGAFANRQVREGATGDDLVIAIRGAIDRVSRGEPIEVDRNADRSNDRSHERDTERKHGRDGDASGSSHRSGRSSSDDRPTHKHGGKAHL